MTTSKKLLIGLITILSTQFTSAAQPASHYLNTQPVYHNHHYHYSTAIDAVAYERDCIRAFVQEIRHENGNVAQWLHQKTIKRDYWASSAEIIEILDIIDNPTLTTEEKIVIFSDKMEEETRAGKTQAQRDEKTIKTVAVCTTVAVLAIVGLKLYKPIANLFLPSPQK